MAELVNPQLSILIVSYNCSGDLLRCLESIHKSVRGISYEVLVRDNSSKDADVVGGFASEKVKVFLGKDNPGFGAANNELAMLASGQFILCLNPDTILKDDVPSALVKHLEEHHECGVCCPFLLNPDGTLQDAWGETPDLFWEFCEGHYLQGFYRKKAWKKRRESGDSIWSVGFVSGACLCLRTETWRSLGGFDPEFFLNHEDVELCDRVRKSGKEVHLLPGHQIVHLEGVTQRQNWARYTYNRQQSKWIYLRKHYHGVSLFMARLLWWESIIIKMVIGFIFLRGNGRTRLAGFIKAAKWVLTKAGRIRD